MFQSYLKNIWANQDKIRFLIVGFINTFASFTVFSLLVFIGINFVISNFLALIFGILFSYFNNKTFVFRNKSKKTLWKYIVLWISIFLFQIFIIWLFKSIIFSPPHILKTHYIEIIGGFFSTILTLPIAYSAQKYWVFLKC